MSATEQPLAGQVAVIAGSGEAFLAPALARRLTEAGAQVIVAEHASADPAAYQALAARALAEHGRLDVWVNAGSAAAPGAAETLTTAAWEAGLRGGLSAAFYGAQAAAAHMLAHGCGVIVNLGTVDAYQAGAGRAVFSAAQGGLVALTRALGVEWAPRGVRVVGVAANWPPSRDPAAPAYAARRLPLGAPASADDVAEAVLFLASAEAGFITGETLRVDAGWTAYHLF